MNIITSSNHHIQMIKERIDSLRLQLLHHPVYAKMLQIDDLKTFMEYHVFAVWDFMSLLKTLQNDLTCIAVPWVPVGTADTRYLINEIVVGEESDVDAFGNRISHFELYLQAMQQVGADTSSIVGVIEDLKSASDVTEILKNRKVPEEVQDFVNFTFEVIKTRKSHIVAGVFTFGREDLIPGMFISIIEEMQRSNNEDVSIFKYYIERHIEVDGSHHSDLALQMLCNLCGDDVSKWAEVHDFAVKALQKRIRLWDAIDRKITG